MDGLQWRPYDSMLAPSVVRLWNRALGENFPMSLRLWRQNVERCPGCRPDDSMVLTGGGEAIGCVITRRFRHQDALRERYATTGWIEALLVDPARQRQGLGSRLLAWARERLRADGAQEIVLGGGFCHFFPGVPLEPPGVSDFFVRRGFQQTNIVHDLWGDLTGFAAPASAQAAVAAAAAVAEPCTPEHAPALLDFLRAEFPGRWRYDTERYLAAGNPPQEYIILRQGRRVIGFAKIHHRRSARLGPPLYWRRLLGRNAGGLGPIGVAADMRGKGLGLALLQLGLEHLAHLGVRQAVIDWTDLVDFYARVGFVPWKSYVQMRA